MVFVFVPGFMSREERKKFEGLHSPYNKYWIPCIWFTNLAAVARSEGRIKDDHTLKLLLEVQTRTHIHVCKAIFVCTYTDFHLFYTLKLSTIYLTLTLT